MHREDIAEKIANSLQRTEAYERVLEVGPGRGMLTQYLLGRDYELLVVEADRDMVHYLQKYYPQLGERLIAADFLRLPLEEVMGNGAFALIGNFPYNISSQILFKMLEYRQQVPELVGMFQHEVAERVVAPPGSKAYGVISVLVQAWYEGEYLFKVDKSAFQPPPKVQSGVIRLRRRPRTDLGCDEKLFRRIVKQTFGQRRKMLRNTLKSFVADHPMLQEDFFQQRPERLSVADFLQLTQRIEAIIHRSS